ncbi:MAG: serine/threonine protein kinase [Deltaproteobacteria bacterium]|nr:serine/threonine protein kinase [Deltaproteobacteria bacterium]
MTAPDPSLARDNDAVSADTMDSGEVAETLASDDARAPTQQLGPFVLRGELGRGGMGSVHRALDTRLGREVALKLLPPELGRDAVRRERFFREARAAAACAHRSIATVFEVGETEGQLWLAMELLEGGTLRSEIRAPSRPIEDVIATLRDLCAGLAAAHGRGIVHRDLKPDNVMRTSDGELRVVDFGLARALASDEDAAQIQSDEAGVPLTGEGQVLGTPGYMAPEQAMGRSVDARADVFAVGVIAFELLAGRSPWPPGGSAMERIVIAAQRPPADLATLRPDTPPELLAWVERALAKAPGQRFADGAEALAALPSGVGISRELPTAQVGAAEPPPPEPAQRGERRSFGRRWLVGLLAAMAALLLIGGVLLRDGRPERLRGLPDLGGGAAAQAAVERAFEAWYRLEPVRALAELEAARAAGADAPLLDVFVALNRLRVSQEIRLASTIADAVARAAADQPAQLALLRFLDARFNGNAEGERQIAAFEAFAKESGDNYALRLIALHFVGEAAADLRLQQLQALRERDPAPLLLDELQLRGLIEAGRADEVLAWGEKLRAAGRLHPWLLEPQAEAMMMLGRRDEARRLWNELLRVDSGQHEARGGLLALALDDGDDATMQVHETALLAASTPRTVAALTLYRHVIRLGVRGRLKRLIGVLDRFCATAIDDEAAAILITTAAAPVLGFGHPPTVQAWRRLVDRAGRAPGQSQGAMQTMRLLANFTETGPALRVPGEATATLNAAIATTEAEHEAGTIDDETYGVDRARLALAAGDLTRAEALLARLSEAPSSPLRRDYVVPTLGLDVAVAKGERDQALALAGALWQRRDACLSAAGALDQTCRIQLARARVRQRWLDGDAKQARTDLQTLLPGADADLVDWLLAPEARYRWERVGSKP